MVSSNLSAFGAVPDGEYLARIIGRTQWATVRHSSSSQRSWKARAMDGECRIGCPSRPGGSKTWASLRQTTCQTFAV